MTSIPSPMNDQLPKSSDNNTHNHHNDHNDEDIRLQSYEKVGLVALSNGDFCGQPQNGILWSTNLSKVPSISAHTRTVTPHTASLMSMFAHPPSTPLTPITPNCSLSVPTNMIEIMKSNGPLLPYDRQPSWEIKEERIPNMEENMKSERFLTDESVFYSSSSNVCELRSSFVLKDEQRDNIESKQDLNLLALKPSSLTRQVTERVKNNSGVGVWHNRDNTLMVHNLSWQEHDVIADRLECSGYDETTALNAPQAKNEPITKALLNNSLMELFQDPIGAAGSYSSLSTKARDETTRLPFLKAISEMGESEDQLTVTTSYEKPHIFRHVKKDDTKSKILPHLSKTACDPMKLKTTLTGAFLYSLYQMVFCFSEASAITRPSHSKSSSGLLAPMALMACVGNLIIAPMLIVALGDFPALYPCLDMFVAPFLAKMAADIDDVLTAMRDDSTAEYEMQDDYEVFFATFAALNAFGMALCGLLCILAGKIKLANLAGFLPYPVLCGFFSAVGINVWISAFKVDTGMTVQKAISMWDGKLLLMDISRHIPSFVAGVALFRLGPRNPAYLVGIISTTIVLAYVMLLITNTSLKEAQDLGFFWKQSEVMLAHDEGNIQRTWGLLGPPSPFGLWFPSVLKKICWPAFFNGLKDVIAMSVIYLLRCSIHATALKKSIANLSEKEAKEPQPLNLSETSENAMELEEGNEAMTNRRPLSVLRVLVWYAHGLLALSISGGFSVLPALSIRGIFIQIGAKSRLPQFIAIFLVFGCYLSDFQLVSYVPKCTFSSLLVLSSIDLINSWFIKSYYKTSQIYEWMVIPFIVSVSLLSGMLESVGLGVGASTFIFVAQFYRSGVVKFVASGIAIRSSIERGWEDSKWLDQHGDMIQILVVQNYLYFGNATSCLNYISTMFDDDNTYEHDTALPPIPKYVILDLSIVTGIDTSAVDVLAEIATLCKTHNCRLILSGIPRTVRPALMVCGLKPSKTYSHLLFMEDLDASLGKAEDALLKHVAHNEERLIKAGNRLKHQRIISLIDNGLRYALNKIDEQHDTSFAQHLNELENYAIAKELEAGEKLNEVQSDSLPRGLYFIESGLIKCEHDASVSLTRGRHRVGQIGTPWKNNDSIGRSNARLVNIAQNATYLKNSPRLIMAQFEHTFRLGRFGPGWVIGTISEFTGQDIPGTYTCVTPCRVHHLTFETIEKLETNKPALVLHLYKMLAHVMARRQELTIGQLSTLRSIMSASTPINSLKCNSSVAMDKIVNTQNY